MRKFLRPTAGIVGALVVGVLAVLAGMQFAAPAATQVEQAIVLAPTSVDGVPQGAPEGDAAVSGATGVAGVVEAGTTDPDALPADVAALIDAIDESGATDPADAWVTVYDAGDAESGPDDPCAPEEGDAPEGCPEGLHSRIFADTAIPPLEVWPYPNAPASPEGTSNYCPDLTPGDGEMRIGVGTSVPAAVSVRYWPVSDPTNVSEVTPDGVQSQVDEWDARFAATGAYPLHEFVFRHCGLMTGLLPNTNYMVSAVAVDSFGRISDAVERPFNTAGNPTVPPMRLVPLTDNLIYVSAPNYGNANPPLLKAWVAAPGESTNCDDFDLSHPALREIQAARLVPVSAVYLNAHNYATGYNRAMVAVYDVPEGSTVVACARWYDQDAPVWNRDDALAQEFIVAESPDQVVPIVTLDHVSVSRALAASAASITASTSTGIVCGDYYFPGEASTGPIFLDPAVPLCDVTTSGAAYRAPLGSGGNMVVTSAVRFGSDTVRARYLLPLSRYACRGVCDLPPDLTYTIPLPVVTTATGMCGSSFGADCTPPTEETSIGTAELSVTWSQGNTNGLDRWVVGSVDSTHPVIPPPPDQPEFDNTVFVTSGLSADGWRAGAEYELRTDRHVTWTSTISGDCFLDGAVTTASGEAFIGTTAGLATSRVVFSGLCPNHEYVVRAELVDDDGHRTVAGLTRGAGEVWWPGAGIFVEGRTLAVAGTVELTRETSLYAAWKIASSRVSYNESPGYAGEQVTFPDDVCLTGDEPFIRGTVSSTTDQRATITIHVYARAYTEGLYFGVNHDADCSWPGPNTWIADETFEVSYADLVRGVTLTGDLFQQGVGRPRPGQEQMHFTVHLIGGLVPSS